MENLSPEQNEQIAAHLAAGRKLEAIKLYRELTHVGLGEAKAFIDRLSAELERADPARFSAAKKSGCFSVLVLVVGALLFLACVLRF